MNDQDLTKHPPKRAKPRVPPPLGVGRNWHSKSLALNKLSHYPETYGKVISMSHGSFRGHVYQETAKAKQFS